MLSHFFPLNKIKMCACGFFVVFIPICVCVCQLLSLLHAIHSVSNITITNMNVGNLSHSISLNTTEERRTTRSRQKKKRKSAWKFQSGNAVIDNIIKVFFKFAHDAPADVGLTKLAHIIILQNVDQLLSTPVTSRDFFF